MSLTNDFHLPHVSEDEITDLIERAGGRRAYENPNELEPGQKNSDFILDDCAVELKILEQDGLELVERQKKIATKIRPFYPDQSVVVLDRRAMKYEARKVFDELIGGSVQTAVRKASKQLKQTRADFPELTNSILFIVNNGFVNIDHEALMEIAETRARNDTSAIDGVIVAGWYMSSDGFENYLSWDMDYISIHGREFPISDRLKELWCDLAGGHLKDMITGPLDLKINKRSHQDVVFWDEGTLFIQPAPAMPTSSVFKGMDRPRDNTTGIVPGRTATIFPRLSRIGFKGVKSHLNASSVRPVTFTQWMDQERTAKSLETATNVLVPIDVDPNAWLHWCATNDLVPDRKSMDRFVASIFRERQNHIVENLRPMCAEDFQEHCFVGVVTREVGKDEAYDRSDIFLVKDGVHEMLLKDFPAFHAYALSLAIPRAIARGITRVLFSKDETYKWL
jgi:hypothetical protein